MTESVANLPDRNRVSVTLPWSRESQWQTSLIVIESVGTNLDMTESVGHLPDRDRVNETLS